MTRKKALEKIKGALEYLVKTTGLPLNADGKEALRVLSMPVIDLSAYDLVRDQKRTKGQAPLRYEGWEGDRVVVLNRKVK